MKYVVTRRFRGKTVACDENGKPLEMNIPYGTEFPVMAGYIATEDGKAICKTTSYNAQHYFAINDDGRGLERGKYTYAIAFAHREKITPEGFVFRFSEEEQKILWTKWTKFLKTEHESVILFNDAFFAADVEELKLLASELNIKVN